MTEPAATAASSARAAALPRVRDAWYVACAARELRRRPRSTRLWGCPLVLFRSADGRPAALVDRCAHRNVPLSMGHVEGDAIVCAYHGWRFGGDGACRAVPALPGWQPGRACHVPMHAAAEAQGLIWIYGTPDVVPASGPLPVPGLDPAPPGAAAVRYVGRFAASLHATAENILDVPHTAFLHGGLFRGGSRRQTLTATVRHGAGEICADYRGEAAPRGLLGLILAPRGGVLAHVDRFALPATAEVCYALGQSTLRITTCLTPEADFVTRMTTQATLRLPAGLAHVVAPLLAPLGRAVAAQDARILAAQTAQVATFGGERHASTAADVLGGALLALLRAAERDGVAAAVAGPPRAEREVTIVV